MLIILLVLLTIAFWIISIYLLSKWKHVYKFALFNLILIAIYYSFIIYGGKSIWGHDEYGLAAFGRLICGVFIHVILGFIFAIYKSFKLRNE